MTNNQIKTGGILAGAGCLFGLAPLAISFAAAGLGSDIGNTLHWYTLFTAPAGAVVVIVGLVTAIVGASMSTPADFAESITSTPGQEKTAGTGTPSDAKPVELPPLPSGLAQIVKIAYAFGFVVVLVSCVMRVTIFQPFSGILTLFDLVPVFFAGWLVFLARNAHEGLGFLRLYQSQFVVSIAGCVVGLWPLYILDTSLGLLEYGDVDVFQLVGSAITSLIPAVASLASLIFAGVARSRYRRGLKSS
ncbi:MAG: hypothetical protein K9G02_02815 [Microbacteriaceae bacterium]|nr:hypothetical protein [Microbacteriaceae bacterium]